MPDQGTGRGNLETPVVSQQELLQHGLGLFNGGSSGEPQFRDQPILEGSRSPFHTPLSATASLVE